eukprot:CAMPEP_0118943172 /NCGR_PEP_ID=MMETSP1169-20130426/37682_1 /TAXON_ID=36882 /ORGANISM="Pyramimonas obovata, Strain CCMP722" /LENGTH=43 /DNA_ID= /DNA_START= /DNA_END= /DNA_ORIENTATION=
MAKHQRTGTPTVLRKPCAAAAALRPPSRLPTTGRPACPLSGTP